MSFIEKLTEKLVARLKVNESRLSFGDVTCGSIVINVTVTDTKNTEITALLKASVSNAKINVFLTVDNLTYIYSVRSVEVLSEPPMPTTTVQTTTPAVEPDGTGMPVPGVNNEDRIRMIIIIASAVGGGMIVLIIFGCCIYCCCQRCKNNSGSFSLGDTPSAYVKSEDVLLEKMPRTPGYYGDEGYVVKAEYQDGNGPNKTSPDSGTFSMGEAPAQNDDNQNEKSNHYDNRNHDDGDVAGRRLSREALVKDQRSESPGYDNPSFSEDEILGGPEDGGYTIEESEHQTEPVSDSVPEQQTEPVTYSVETDPQPAHAEPATYSVVSEVDTDLNQKDSKHSSLSNVSSVSIQAESFPPPPAFITDNVAADTDSHDGGSNLEPHNQSDQVESSEVTLPADHIEVTLTTEDQNPGTEICDDHRSSSSNKDQQSSNSNVSESSSSSSSDSDSKHSYNVNSENPSLSHKDSAPTIEFPPPPEDAPETADQGSITELDYNHEDDLHQHESHENKEKTTAEKEAESATLF